MITFNHVNDTRTPEQKENIWDWCKDHAEHFGSIPMEYAEWDNVKGDDDIWNYDQMLSALTQSQINELNTIIALHEQR